MKMSNAFYDKLKWAVVVLLPACSTLYAGLGDIWQFPNVAQVVGTISCVTLFLGALLQISNANYKKEQGSTQGDTSGD